MGSEVLVCSQPRLFVGEILSFLVAAPLSGRCCRISVSPLQEIFARRQRKFFQIFLRSRSEVWPKFGLMYMRRAAASAI